MNDPKPEIRQMNPTKEERNPNDFKSSSIHHMDSIPQNMAGVLLRDSNQNCS